MVNKNGSGKGCYTVLKCLFDVWRFKAGKHWQGVHGRIWES